ncbi:MAG: hypothetical protein IIB58_03235 [Planctomycetes bacterium]|nr:hypothetical protein [Planctomycetota bacterium]
MNRRHIFLLLALAWAASNSEISRAAQEQNAPENSEMPQASAAQGQPGYLLSDGMVRAMLKRTAYELARNLKMDDEQARQLSRRADEVWMPFFAKHRAEVAPVVDRMLQAQWDPDLPSAEEAQVWARKALKVHDLLVEHMAESNQEIAKMLTPEQLDNFRRLAAQFDGGLKWFKLELEKMERGELSETAWAGRRLRRQERRRRYERKHEQRQAEKILASPKLLAVTVDAWDAYVAQFVAQFNLDNAQKLAAGSVLIDVKARAEQYSKAHADELQAATNEMTQATQEQRKSIMDDKAELMQPLNELFAELKSRLEQIPTEAQRSKAELPAQAEPAGNS